jgi:hypothetical protein
MHDSVIASQIHGTSVSVPLAELRLCSNAQRHMRKQHVQACLMGSDRIKAMTSQRVLNRISTGSTAVDLAICCALPAAAKAAQPRVAALLRWLRHRRHRASFTRTIAYTERNGYAAGSNEQNRILQEAILLYLGAQHDVVRQYQVCFSCHPCIMTVAILACSYKCDVSWAASVLSKVPDGPHVYSSSHQKHSVRSWAVNRKCFADRGRSIGPPQNAV